MQNEDVCQLLPIDAGLPAIYTTLYSSIHQSWWGIAPGRNALASLRSVNGLKKKVVQETIDHPRHRTMKSNKYVDGSGLYSRMQHTCCKSLVLDRDVGFSCDVWWFVYGTEC